MRISDWSSDVCSSDLWLTISSRDVADACSTGRGPSGRCASQIRQARISTSNLSMRCGMDDLEQSGTRHPGAGRDPSRTAKWVIASQRSHRRLPSRHRPPVLRIRQQLARLADRSEEHTSELQSLMRITYAVFCLKK